MRKPLIALALALVSLVAFGSPAHAADKTITIKPPLVPQGQPSVSPQHLDITEGDTITFVNEDSTAHTVTFRTGGKSFSVPAKTGATAGTYTLPPVGGSFDYYLDANPDPDGVGGSVTAAPAPTTTTTAPVTTTTAQPTTTTAAPTTTTASTTTSTSSTTTSTTSTSTTTSTTVPTTISAAGGGSSGSSSAVLLAIAALVVAVLAGLAFVAYRRSQEPPYDDPDGWDGPEDWTDGEPPPTTMGPIT